MNLSLQPNRRRLGFTLIEMMVVLVLIGIVTAMILPEMRGTYEAAVLRSASRELVSVFNVAYSRAVTLNQPHRVRIEPASRRYVLERQLQGDRSNVYFAPVRDVPGSEGKLDARITIEVHHPEDDPPEASDPEASPVSHAAPPARTTGEGIMFHPDGTAEAGEVRLRDRDGFRLALRVNPITARVQVIELERL